MFDKCPTCGGPLVMERDTGVPVCNHTKDDEVAIGIVLGVLLLFIIGSICGIIVAVMKFVELVS